MLMESETREGKNGITWEIEFRLDESPDTSWLGEYTDGPNWDAPVVIDRKANGDMERHEYRYFVPGHDVEDSQAWYKAHGYSKHQAWLLPRQHARQDYARMEGLNKGDWHFMGVCVKAMVNGQEVAADSVWGVESDIDESYLEEIVQDCMTQCEAQFTDALEQCRDTVEALERIAA